jgi:arylsulfatase A-like enzyme/Tfp pilus assembly protein PilF
MYTFLMATRCAIFLLIFLAQAAAAVRPNIVLITLDTTRADHMGFLGSKRGATPHLDALARQSVVFTRAYSQVPLTTASHAAILTGTYPQFNHVVDFGVPLAAGLPYLPDILHGDGYHTAAFVASLVLDPLDGTAPGFDRGFEVYDAGFHLRARGADRYQTVERRAGEVVSHALAWLGARPRGPFFLWVHLYDAHDPYDPPAPYRQRFASDLYDGEIAYADSQVGRLLTALRTQGIYDNTLIAVMADHGEAFGEHGERTHGVFLYDETIHVPLLFKLPAPRSAGKRIESRAGLVDVAPTILKEAGIPVPKEMQGESLLGAAAGHAPDRAIYSETDYPHRAFGWSALQSLRSSKYLYIQAPERELYDQSADAGAVHNLAAQSRAVSDTLSAQLEEFRGKTSQSLVALAKPDPEQMEKLQALGYVASGTGKTGGDEKPAGADPKEKIEIANVLHFSMLDVEDGRYADALPKLEKVLKLQPEMPVAQLQLGIALAKVKRYQEAIPALKKSIELRPDFVQAHYELGLALFETGKWRESAPYFEYVAEQRPKWADAHFSLAAVYARIDRVPEAVSILNDVLSVNPDHFRANLLLGRIIALQGKPAEALPKLEKAAKLQPASMDAHLFLADAYEQLGRPADALRERTRAEGLRR